MGNTFKPITLKETLSIQLGDICAGISSMQGCRREMEDGHINEIIEQDHLFLGVFDGHGGIGCVQYVCGIVNQETTRPFFEDTKDLIQILKETDEFKKYVREGKQDIKLLEKAKIPPEEYDVYVQQWRKTPYTTTIDIINILEKNDPVGASEGGRRRSTRHKQHKKRPRKHRKRCSTRRR